MYTPIDWKVSAAAPNQMFEMENSKWISMGKFDTKRVGALGVLREQFSGRIPSKRIHLEAKCMASIEKTLQGSRSISCSESSSTLKWAAVNAILSIDVRTKASEQKFDEKSWP